MEEVRHLMEDSLASLDVSTPVRISKERLREHASCPGWFDAVLSAEAEPFRHSFQSASGSLSHRALELDVAAERRPSPRSVVERASRRLPEEDGAFRELWATLDPLDRAEMEATAAAHVALFREMFPPLRRRWQPVAEQSLRARLLDGRVVLSGRVDLMLGRRSKLIIDFKSGEPRTSDAQDMRFYALLAGLVFGAPPYRVATVFLQAMEWQVEEVTEDVLIHAAERVVGAVSFAVSRVSGDGPVLTPGAHCRFCPRRETCPSSSLWRSGRRASSEVPVGGVG